MNIFDVLASWRQSLAIFEKKNFKLFFLVSLKTLKTALPFVLRYGGVLLVPCVKLSSVTIGGFLARDLWLPTWVN